MGETVNIKEMADTLAEQIFDIFLWEKCLATDYRWMCVESNNHRKVKDSDKAKQPPTKVAKKAAKRKIKQHPSDAVFTYEDPYRGFTTHINADLKSYSKSTMGTFDLEGTLVSLAQAVECAHKSETFSEAFGNGGDVHAVDGLLFVYNHDGEYDRDFDDRLQQLSGKSLSIRENHRLFVMGPERVVYIYSVARDIEARVAKLVKKADYDHYKFYSPELRVTKIKGEKYGPAPIEALIGPWMFVTYFATRGEKLSTVVYYDGAGESQDEFKYLIDAILSMNLLEDGTPIEVALQTSNDKTPIHFAAALKAYAVDNHGRTDDSLPRFQARLRRISYAGVAKVTPPFMENEIAIRNG